MEKQRNQAKRQAGQAKLPPFCQAYFPDVTSTLNGGTQEKTS
jgi:hypothetical protein